MASTSVPVLSMRPARRYCCWARSTGSSSTSSRRAAASAAWNVDLRNTTKLKVMAIRIDSAMPMAKPQPMPSDASDGGRDWRIHPAKIEYTAWMHTAAHATNATTADRDRIVAMTSKMPTSRMIE